MGLLLPIVLLKSSANNTQQLFNKINDTILELENKNKSDKDKYESDIAILNEKNKKLEQNLEKERITNQELKDNNNKLELIKEDKEKEIEKEREININKEKEVKNLKDNIDELNKKINKSLEVYKTNLEKCRNKIKEKENNIKSLTQKIEDQNKIIEENENQIKELSESVETYINNSKVHEDKIKKIIDENNKKQSDIIQQNKELKNKLKEQNLTLKKKDEQIKSYELKINEVNQKNNIINKELNEVNKNTDIINKEIEIISQKYKQEFEEKISKTKKSLIKQIGEQLTNMRKKYTDLIRQKGNLMDAKCEEIIKKSLNEKNIKLENINNINLKDVQNIDIKKSNYNINLNDDDNDLLSKTQIITNTNKINFDNIQEKNIINNFKDTNNNKNKIDEINNNKNKVNEITPKQNITPQGQKDNKKNIELQTPKGDENINNITPGENLEYSFDCTNAMYLTLYIYEGTKEDKLNIILNNNGNKAWPNDTKLKIIEPSDFELDDITLKSQRPGEEKTYYIKFKNLENYKPGIYQANLAFCCNGEIYGEKLVARVKINKLNDTNKEIEENMDKINEFRTTFDLPVDEFPDEKILSILQENDFNFEKSFSAIFG